MSVEKVIPAPLIRIQSTRPTAGNAPAWARQGFPESPTAASSGGYFIHSLLGAGEASMQPDSERFWAEPKKRHNRGDGRL